MKISRIIAVGAALAALQITPAVSQLSGPLLRIPSTPIDYGAAGDGTKDDTAAVNTACAAQTGKTLNLGPFVYAISGPINCSGVAGITGASRSGAIGAAITNYSGFKLLATNVNPILTVGSNARIEHFMIYANATGVNTSGTTIYAPFVGNTTIDDVWIQGPCLGIDISGSQNRVTNSWINGQQGAGCGGVRVGHGGTNSVTIDMVIYQVKTASSQTTPADYGIRVEDAGGASISTDDNLFAKFGIQIAPGANQVVWWTTIGPGYTGDSNTVSGLSIDTTDPTAVVRGLECVGCWASSSALNGIDISNTGNGTTSGTVDGIHFTGTRVFQNAQNGINIHAGTTINPKHVTIDDSAICGNSFGNAATYSGIAWGTGVSFVSIRDSESSGNCDGFSSSPAFGVNFTGTTSTDIIMVGNDFTGNSSGPAAGVLATTGANVVSGNKGLDDVLPTVASAATIALNALYPRWTVTGSVGVSTINNPWLGRHVTLFTTSGVAFATGGNICNAVTTAANGLVYADWTGSCWELK